MNSKTICILIFFFLATYQMYGQSDSYEEPQDLGQKTQNPLADLIVIPFQNNFIFDGTQNKQTGYILNIQPVFPLALGKISLINRAVFGFGYVPGIYKGDELISNGSPDDGEANGTWGLLDLNFTTYITPKPNGAFSWGIGPSLTIPTATDNRLGSGKWKLGASLVFVWQPANWTIDAIFRQLWSVAGSDDRGDVNQFFIQPLVAYNLKNGWALATMPVIVANWNYDQENKWLVPIGGGVNKLFYLNKTPVLLMFHYYYNIIKPELVGTSELRIQFSFIFPQ
jgi:hypothetical protein